MKNKKVITLIGIILAVILIILAIFINKSATTNDNTVNKANITTESSEKEKVDNTKTEETQKFNGIDLTEEPKEPEEPKDNTETAIIISTEDIEKETEETEVLKTGTEYDFPPEIMAQGENKLVEGEIKPNGSNYGDNNLSTSHNTYYSHNIKVDMVDGYEYVKVTIVKEESLFGENADTKLIEYNNVHKAKYLLDCDTDWENCLIKFKIDYSKVLDNSNEKIEPIISIGNMSYGTGINYKGSTFNIPVTLIYENKSEHGREGYIVIKLPKSLNKFYINFGDIQNDEVDASWQLEFNRE